MVRIVSADRKLLSEENKNFELKFMLSLDELFSHIDHPIWDFLGCQAASQVRLDSVCKLLVPLEGQLFLDFLTIGWQMDTCFAAHFIMGLNLQGFFQAASLGHELSLRTFLVPTLCALVKSGGGSCPRCAIPFHPKLPSHLNALTRILWGVVKRAPRTGCVPRTSRGSYRFYTPLLQSSIRTSGYTWRNLSGAASSMVAR